MQYNEFGEVISVNGIITGQHLGAPTQDAIAEKPEDNQAYATELNTVTRLPNCEQTWEEQPKPIGDDSICVDFNVTMDTETGTMNATCTMPFSEVFNAVVGGKKMNARLIMDMGEGSQIIYLDNPPSAGSSSSGDGTSYTKVIFSTISVTVIEHSHTTADVFVMYIVLSFKSDESIAVYMQDSDPFSEPSERII